MNIKWTFSWLDEWENRNRAKMSAIQENRNGEE